MGCGTTLLKNESYLCLNCAIRLPRTNFNLIEVNPLHKILKGRINFKYAASFLYYRKEGLTQRLLHTIKYKGKKDFGEFLSFKLAMEWQQVLQLQQFDLITCVPLHANKLRKRGYNQSECIANGISKAIGVPCHFQLLIRTKDNETQTNKKRYYRWENTKDIFKINNAIEFENKHILIIDDVITTGATLESCCAALQNIKGCRISVLSLCIATF